MGCRRKFCDAYYMEFERRIRDHLFAAGATPGGRVSKPDLKSRVPQAPPPAVPVIPRLLTAGDQAGFGPAGLDLRRFSILARPPLCVQTDWRNAPA